MSKLRPECYNAPPGIPSLPRDTALYLIRDAVERRNALIHGKLHGPNGLHCAIGAFWDDNPSAILPSDLIDEVAAVNDSLGPLATPRERWEKVSSWLRWKLRVLAGEMIPKPARKKKK